MTTQVQPENSNIKEFQIINNQNDNSIDMREGTPVFQYYENILSNHITASAQIVETGKSIEGDDGKLRNAIDGLPIRGGEIVRFEAEDKAGNKITFKGDKALYVNKISNVFGNKSNITYNLNFCTKEFLANAQTRCVKRYKRPAKISDHVKDILKNTLKTTNFRDEDIEETQQSYEFIGNSRKPFHVITWLAQKSIPADSQPKASAGYYFYETQDGFQFRSVDGLLSDKEVASGNNKSPKAFKYKGTNFSGENSGPGNIISYEVLNTIDLQSNMMIGAYVNNTLYFDPYTFECESVEYKMEDSQWNKVKTGGSETVDYVKPEFREGPTRLMTRIKDNGILPSGADGDKQLSTWKEEPSKDNDEMASNMVQSVMRYTQMFTLQLQISVPGDFSIRAGEIIYCEFPDKSENQSDNKDLGGYYVVANLCHQITATDTVTSMSLIRDSYGKKPL